MSALEPRRNMRPGSPAELFSSLFLPLWAGVALGVAELAALGGASTQKGVAVACLALGLALTALVVVPLRLLRAGLEAAVQARRTAAEQRRQLSALLLSASLFLLGASRAAIVLQAAQLRQQVLGGWLLALLLVPWLLLCWGAHRLMVHCLRWAGRRHQRILLVVLWLLPLMVLAAAGLQLKGALEPAWGALDIRSILLLLAWLALSLAGVFAARLLPRRVALGAAVLPVLALVVTLPVALSRLASAPAARAALSNTDVLWVVPRAMVSLSDRDGDGYASLLGGGDCDDDDPKVHPAALERLGSGRDENCDGQALSLEQDPTRGTLTGKLPSAACRSEHALPRRTNVLLIAVDALRADRLAQGYPRKVVPRLEQLATQSVVFSRCYSPHPSTAYAFPALVTGMQTRWARDLMRSQLAKIPHSRPMPQQLLAKLGYRSAAIYGHYLAGSKHRITGGMTSAKLVKGKVTAEKVTDQALRYIKRFTEENKPFYLFAHYYDPHWVYWRYPAKRAPWGNKSRLDRYDAELYNVDRAVGRLLDSLRKDGLYDNTLIVLVSDHGEEFGEHGGEFHGKTMYEEVVRVPCLIRAPGVAPRTVQQPVSLVDMLPTMLDLLGVNMPKQQGYSLEPLMLAKPGCTRPPVVGEMQPWRKKPPFKPWLWYLVSDRHKLIYDVESNAYELYDLAVDPAERDNLVERHPELFGRLRAELHAQVSAHIALPLGSQARKHLSFR